MDETFIQERIRQLVADSGKSEKLVSRELGRSAGYIQSLTSGKSMPSLLMFFQVCAYFDIEPRDFFDPHISYPLPIQHILSYIYQMTEEDLAVLEPIAQRLCISRSEWEFVLSVFWWNQSLFKIARIYFFSYNDVGVKRFFDLLTLVSYNISNNIHVLIRKEAANHEDSQIIYGWDFRKRTDWSAGCRFREIRETNQ